MIESQLCGKLNDKLFGLVRLNWVLMEQFSVLIVCYSLIARALLKCIIKSLRFSSESLQTVIILFGVCVVYSLNYMLLYLTAPFNVSKKWNHAQNDQKQFIPYGDQDFDFGPLSWLAQGIYKDYNMSWFRDIGVLVLQSYMILIVIPPIEFAAVWFIRLLLRAYDQGKCCCRIVSLPF